MELIQRREREQTGGRRGVFDAQEAEDASSATVISGPYMQQLSVAGMTVGQIRERMATRLDIDPRSMAVIDGQDVDDERILRPSECLIFVQRAGEKGGTA
jgi:hypothetical protein